MKKIIFTFVFVFLLLSFAYSQYGTHWVLKPSGTLSSLNSAFAFVNNSTGFICGANGTVLSSTNCGETWSPKPIGINTNLYSVYYGLLLSPNTFFELCCGDNGIIMYSSNYGTNWTQINSGTSVKLNCIVVGNQTAFAVGNSGVIVKSTWTSGTFPPFTQAVSGTTSNLKSIYCGPAYFICGDNGTVLKSSNQGTSWIQIPFPSTVNLNSIFVNTDSTVFVCGNNGAYYKSTNYGLNWSSEITGTTNNLNSLQRTSNVTGPSYIVGASGTVLYNPYSYYYSIWKKKNISGTVDLNGVFEFSTSSANPFFTIGTNGSIFKRVIDTAMFTIDLSGNNISSKMNYGGTFDQNIMIQNTPGFEWPTGSNKHVIFTTGLSAGCRINGQLAQTMCSYKGEYQPGCITNGQLNDSDIFKPYRVSRSDSPSNPDWMNWGCMVPYGAPFIDVNHNGIYEPLIDTPGVKNAAQTVFICLTDINPFTHSAGEGFGGGITSPLMGIELHLTKWSYSYPSFSDVTFSKFEIINKSLNAWNNTYFAFVSDIDLGGAEDDLVGCDTVRNMGYGYNGDNEDLVYGTAPPAVGLDILRGPVNKRVVPNVIYNMTSFVRFGNPSGIPPNESDPNGEPYPAYLMLKGFKKDSASWLDRTQPTPWGSYKRTKKIFYGDPETNEGWTSAKGYLSNCCLDSVGTQVPEVPGDKRIVLGMGADNYTVNSGDTAVIWLAQLVARGSSNLNSVTKLKQLSDITQTFFESNFTIGINQISSEIPERYSLSQNYPNPFNPVTKIKYSVAKLSDVKLVVYDILGRRITELVNEKQSPGVYEVVFDVSSEKMRSLASGVYFYRMTVVDPLGRTGNFSDTKRMVILK
jgi:photosystem II stability/assembly factor-like uncharacterized protein